MATRGASCSLLAELVEEAFGGDGTFSWLLHAVEELQQGGGEGLWAGQGDHQGGLTRGRRRARSHDGVRRGPERPRRGHITRLASGSGQIFSRCPFSFTSRISSLRRCVWDRFWGGGTVTDQEWGGFPMLPMELSIWWSALPTRTSALSCDLENRLGWKLSQKQLEFSSIKLPH